MYSALNGHPLRICIVILGPLWYATMRFYHYTRGFRLQKKIEKNQRIFRFQNENSLMGILLGGVGKLIMTYMESEDSISGKEFQGHHHP